MKHHAVLVLALSLTLFAVGCGDGDEGTSESTSVSYPVTVSFGAEEGVDMVAGEHMVPGNFANSDLVAQANGDDLKLSTGGPNAIHLRAAEWFQNGGIADVFSGLDTVPNTPLPTGDGLPLIHTKTGNGFIIQASTGTYFKGYVSAASATSVTIEYEPIL